MRFAAAVRFASASVGAHERCIGRHGCARTSLAGDGGRTSTAGVGGSRARWRGSTLCILAAKAAPTV
eukprot:4318003-Pleurochrysis_carterae.AAC.1